MDFSLFYFASDHGDVAGRDKYRLLIDGATFADHHGFRAVWVPERHFDRFGGPFPNPAIAAAALTQITEHVELRAGSVVAPLHHPLRIAEDWSMVDHLSNGRVGLSFAPGWAPNDFAIAPERFAARREIMVENVHAVRRLWRGDPIELENGAGEKVNVRTFPVPAKGELPLWLTVQGRDGSTQSAEAAGALGVNMLTHLFGHRIDDLRERISAYRRARREAGNDDPGIVTLMLHTYVHDLETTPPQVLATLGQYLNDSFNLSTSQTAPTAANEPAAALDERGAARLSLLSANRFANSTSLVGNTDHCLRMVEQAAAAGVDEIACLVDFGLPDAEVLGALDALAGLAGRCA